jgi:hypothetical protein
VDETNQEALTASTGLVRYNSPRTVPGKVSLAARSPWRGKRGLRVEGQGSRVEGRTEDFRGGSAQDPCCRGASGAVVFTVRECFPRADCPNEGLPTRLAGACARNKVWCCEEAMETMMQ